MKWFFVSIGLLILSFAAYCVYAVKNSAYEYKIISYRPKVINLKTESILDLTIEIMIKSAFFFNIPVQSLYYEIYYKDALLGSSQKSSFDLLAGKENRVIQKVDVRVNYKTMEVVEKFLSKTPVDYKIKIYATIMSISINLKNIKFTY